jgi:hypothetical protein
VCENRGKKPQVPPLRFAPVGMTILFAIENVCSQAELSSRPERSVVEGPAVSFPGSHTHSLGPEVFRCRLFRSLFSPGENAPVYGLESPNLARTETSIRAAYGVPEVNVHVLMFWIAVDPPVPPVKPT